MLPHIHAVYLRRRTKCVEIAKLPLAEQKQQLAALEKQPSKDVADIFANLFMGGFPKYRVRSSRIRLVSVVPSLHWPRNATGWLSEAGRSLPRHS